MVGPDYKGPPQVLGSGKTSFVRGADVQTADFRQNARWWAALDDPELDRLEIAAFGANPDLAAATARLRQARAQLHAQGAQLLPNTGTSAVLLHTHSGSGLLGGLLGGAGGEAVVPSDMNLYDVGFDATWEVDLFGGRRRAVEGAAAAAQASLANLADAHVSLSAEVAGAYVGLRDIQHRLALSQANAELQGRILALTRRRLVGGTASDLDVERLNTQVEQTRADIVPLRAQLEQQLNRIAILTGRLPGELDAELGSLSSVPLPPSTVTVGDPASLLRNRPDIRAAERQMATQNAAIGQRVADYFPKLELLGNLGFSSTDIGHLFTGAAFTAVAAPVLQWKPFDFGRTRAAVEQARAGFDEAVASYRTTVLRALEDAETSLSRYSNQRQSVAGLQRVKASADRAAALTRRRYEGGTASLIDLLDTERQRVQAEQALAQAEANLTQDFIGLQKSLGLGWQPGTRQLAGS